MKITFHNSHWFQILKGETLRFHPDYEIKDLTAFIHCILLQIQK